MHKIIWIAFGGASLALALACGASEKPRAAIQPQVPTLVSQATTEPTPSGQGLQPGVSERAESTQVSQIGVSSINQQQGDRQQSGHQESSVRNEPPETAPTAPFQEVTSLPDIGPETGVNTQLTSKSFLEEIGREYPGLLSLPECGPDTLITKAPLADDSYRMIIPLGLLTVPQHVLPTSHVYYHLVPDSAGGKGGGTAAVTEVWAPGNIRILGVNSSESTGGPQGDYIDYDVMFAPCRSQMFQFLHVSTLVPSPTLD